MMTTDKKREIVENALAKGNGILRLEPAWVARDFLPPGRRLGLKEEEYDVGERGWISERWLGSTTKADNRIGPPDEGLSYIALEGNERVTLRDAVAVAGSAIIGEEYAKTHEGLGRLPKIYDYGLRITINTDNRLVSDTNVTKELYLTAKHLNLNLDDIKLIIVDGFKSAFLPNRAKSIMLNMVNDKLNKY